METTTTEEKEVKVKSKYIDPVGRNIYGDEFVGFQKIAEFRDLIIPFKEYYYQEKIKNDKTTLGAILKGFNEEQCRPVERFFHPSLSQVRTWRKKWDLDLMQQRAGRDIVLVDDVEKKNIRQVLKTRENKELVLGSTSDNELEAGVRTLGGELLNDAMQMLRDDQELEEIYEPEVLVKRRAYIVNVFAHATRLVHGKAALMLKASEEKRNNAGFLMSLLAKASAGKMSDAEMNLLKTAYVPKKDVVTEPV